LQVCWQVSAETNCGVWGEAGLLVSAFSRVCAEGVQDKIVPAHLKKSYRGSRGVVPPVLNLDIRSRSLGRFS
jgi:hypothetical protein